MPSIYKPPQGKGTFAGGAVIGIAVSGLLFLAISLTQIFSDYKKAPEEIQSLEVAPPPPPPPPEEPPPPPEPEKEEPPPELDTPPPPISLEQLEMALNPGTGGSMAGDFALPSFELKGDALGGLDIFELGDVDSPPRPRTKIEFRYPAAAKRRNIRSIVKVEYIVNESGSAEQITITNSADPLLADATTDVLRRARFEPAVKDGRPVKVRMRATIPFK